MDLDLSKLTDAELDGLERGDLSMFSDESLDFLESQITPEPYLVGAAKNFGSGVVEGVASLAGLASDVGDLMNPLAVSRKMSKPVLRMEDGKPTLGTAGVGGLFDNSVEISKAVEPYLAEKDPQYRYYRTAGEFVGPNLVLPGEGLVAKAPTLLGKAWTGAKWLGSRLLDSTPQAVGAQTLEDVFPNSTIAPMVGAALGGGAAELTKDAASATRAVLKGATPEQIKGTAAKVLQEQTGLTPRKIEVDIALRPKDQLGDLMTTAEVTDNAGMAQIEKTLSGVGTNANQYKTVMDTREGYRDQLLNRITPAESVNKEALGTKLKAAATGTEKRLNEEADIAWDSFPRHESIDITPEQATLAEILDRKQAGLPYKSPVRTLTEQFLGNDAGVPVIEGVATSGALQDIRSSALSLRRDANLSDAEMGVLSLIEKSIDGALERGLVGDAYNDWRNAKAATRYAKESFAWGTAGDALTQPQTLPAELLTRAFKGNAQSIKELKTIIGNNPNLIDEVKRGVLDMIPRDSQGRLTAAKMKSFLAANEGGLAELMGQQHYGTMGRILEDLQSEARTGQIAFAASKGNSVTSQRDTVAGALNDLITDSLIPAPTWAAKFLNTIREGAGLRDKAKVQQWLFKAALNPEVALDLAKTPTRVHIQNGIERLASGFIDTIKGGVKGGAISLVVPENGRQSQTSSHEIRYQNDGTTQSNVALVGPRKTSTVGALTAQPQAQPTPSSNRTPTKRQQTSALLSSAFSPVSTDSLIESVFGQQPNAIISLFGDYMHPKTIYDAIAQVESSGNPHAKSPVGAQGLMQIMPATYREWAPKVGLPADSDPYDADNSRRVGEAYFDFLTQRYGDPALALAAYNWGLGRVDKAIKEEKTTDLAKLLHRFPEETRKYVTKVMGLMEQGNEPNTGVLET